MAEAEAAAEAAGGSGGSSGGAGARAEPPSLLASRLLRQLRRVRMTAGARRLVRSFVAGLYGRVSAEAERLRRARQLPRAGADEVRAALERVLPRHVAQAAAAAAI